MIRVVFCLALLTLPAWGQTLTRSASCEESNFYNHGWPHVNRAVPALQTLLTDIAQSTGDAQGSDVKVTNCWVKWPVDKDGRSLNGMRTFVMDKVWYKDGQKYHAGAKVRYYKSQKEVNGRTEIYRSVKGFMICRTPNTCKEFGIPYADKLPATNTEGSF